MPVKMNNLRQLFSTELIRQNVLQPETIMGLKVLKTKLVQMNFPKSSGYFQNSV